VGLLRRILLVVLLHDAGRVLVFGIPATSFLERALIAVEPGVSAGVVAVRQIGWLLWAERPGALRDFLKLRECCSI
jgi:hypothetical protein